MNGYKKAIIALSLDEKSDAALLKGAFLRLPKTTEVILVHVTNYMVSYEAAFGVSGGQETDELLRSEAEAYLKKQGKKFDIAEKNQTVLVGPAAAVLVDYCKENKVDLVVMGRHELHGLKTLLGSTADGVLHHAPCDLLALHLPS